MIYKILSKCLLVQLCTEFELRSLTLLLMHWCRQCKSFTNLQTHHLSIDNKQKIYRKDKFTIHSKAVVCQDVELKGDITIGAGNNTTQWHLGMRVMNIFFYLYRVRCPSQGNHICYCRTHRYRPRLYYRRKYYNREQVKKNLRNHSLQWRYVSTI